MAIGFDESVRDNLVSKSSLFQRFVNFHLLNNIGLGKAEVLQVNHSSKDLSVPNYLKLILSQRDCLMI
jgi:hypothetical protein